jgi:hypothetical protein
MDMSGNTARLTVEIIQDLFGEEKMETIENVIAWGRVFVQGKEYILLSPRPFSSEVVSSGVSRSTWQGQGSYKWEVADAVKYNSQYSDNLDEDGERVWIRIYTRSIIIFNSDALIEFYQDPQTIKVKYIIPEVDDDNQI